MCGGKAGPSVVGLISSHLRNKEDYSMTWTIRSTRSTLLAVTLVGALLSLPLTSFGNAPATSDASARLDKKQYQNVKVSVDQGVATLTGTVDLYANKDDAEKRVRKAKGVTAVHNLIEVAGPTISDQELQAKLQEKLTYDRVFYGNTFDAIGVTVKNGAVTLGGHAHNFFNRNSAVDLVRYFPGVKDFIDELQVDPISVFDDRTRIQVAHAIYGYPFFSKYAMNPAKPIRISVQNGNVTLYGVVDSQADKDVATLRANSVFGVFNVKNFLYIAPPDTTRKN
jgi:osmotically-inducible protein OsmY